MSQYSSTKRGMAIQESDDCQKLAAELHGVLEGADAQWRALEARLEEVEEGTLREHAKVLQQWFGEEVRIGLSDWAAGGIRRKTRDRVHKLLLAPIVERLRRQLPAFIAILEAGANVSVAPEPNSHPIDALLEHWSGAIQPILDNATREDAKLAKKLQRLQAVGALRDVKREEQKRTDLWTTARVAIVEAEESVRTLADLLNAEIGTESDNRDMARVVAPVPSIVARSVCDWHFQRCLSEFEQMRAWWQGLQTAFQRRPDVWERLLEEEGVFVRRIERGIEEIQAQKCRYNALALFGHSGSLAGCMDHEWPAEKASMLARAVNEMRRRLRPIRDSAAWRIIDSAKSIQKAIAAEQKSKEGSPWEQLGSEEGMSVLRSSLGVAELSIGGTLDPADSAICLSGVLDRLVGIITDLGNLSREEATPDTGGVSYILEEVLQGISYVQEDLLAVMDDATEARLLEWLSQSWCQWGDASAGRRLEAAMSSMPLKPDSAVPPEKRQARRSQLALMRGLQALIVDRDFRARLFEAADIALSSGRPDKPIDTQAVSDTCNTPMHSDMLEVVDIDALELKRPAEAHMLASPRSSYICRKPQKIIPEQEVTIPVAAESLAPSVPVEIADSIPKTRPAEDNAPVDDVLSRSQSHSVKHSRPSSRCSSTPAGHRKPSKSSYNCVSESPGSTGTGSSARACTPTRFGASETRLSVTSSEVPPTPGKRPRIPSRPVTPSWLDPPWPRQEVPFQSWSRPGTPSTVCDEADLTLAPKHKFIDGQYIPLRPASSSKRLPPINSGYPTSSRALW